jgi:hypothetical protein
MSGGHYDYAYSHLMTLASDIQADCIKYAKSGKDGNGYEYEAMPPDIIAHMKWVSEQIELLAEAAHDIEWLMSDDYGYDTLRERCKSWHLTDHLREKSL